MCIIIAKDKIGRLPTEQELRNSFYYNGDGAGFMYVDNGKVVIDKGYMNIDSFIKHFKSLCDRFNDFNNKSLVIHCRIGTSGKNDKGNTHPYPITDDKRALKSRHLYGENIGIAHNGIIHGYGTATGLNDTQEYISKYLYPLYHHYRDFYKNKDMLYQMEMATSSKFAILDKTDTIYYVGDFIEDKGLWFSNNSYKTWQERYSYNTYDYGYSKYSGYQYDYDDYEYYDSDYKTYSEKDIDDDKEEFLTGEESDKATNEFYMFKLPSEWQIDLYRNGNLTLVGNKDYYFNYETLELYEKIDGDFVSVIDNPIVYDENNEEMF